MTSVQSGEKAKAIHRTMLLIVSRPARKGVSNIARAFHSDFFECRVFTTSFTQRED